MRTRVTGYGAAFIGPFLFWRPRAGAFYLWLSPGANVVSKRGMLALIAASFMKRPYAGWCECAEQRVAGEWSEVLKRKSKSPGKVETHQDHPGEYTKE